MNIKIVTDSTSDLPDDLINKLGITVIPLNVSFGTENYKDKVTISSDTFYKRLSEDNNLPKTSQPSPGDFKEIYDSIEPEKNKILSIHVTAKMSGTYNSAVQGRAQSKMPENIEVIDTGQVSMGLGLTVIKAAEAVLNGQNIEEVKQLINQSIKLSECFCLLETLEYVEKGGRIGKAQAILGSVLKIKPMIIMKEGEVHDLAKVRTFNKGLTRLIETVKTFSPIETIAVMHSTTPDLAESISEEIKNLLPDISTPYLTRFGPVIGTYSGPGAIGIGLIRKK